MAVLWLKGKYKLWHFLLFPVFYVLLVLPAVALGKPFLETLTLYASQTGSIGDGLNYNSPSVYAFFQYDPSVTDLAAASRVGIIAAFVFMCVILAALCHKAPQYHKRRDHRGVRAFRRGYPFSAAAHA